MPTSDDSSTVRSEASSNKQSENYIENEDKRYLSSSSQAQTFLTALRNMIIPLIQTAVPNAQDLHQVPFGPDAEDFLIALQRYISSVIRDRSQSESKARIIRSVELEEKFPTTNLTTQAVDVSDQSENDEESSPAKSSPHEYILEADWDEKPLHGADWFASPCLHIRLLAFTKHDSKLNITLLDRNELYSVLATKLHEQSKVDWLNLHNHWREIASYAILSHTWLRSPSGPGEVTYDEWPKGIFDLTQPGYRKLVNFCRVALNDHGLTLGWIDTICINKESSSELDESIRSMYKWYKKAKVCVTYLADTTSLSNIAEDAWFTRGWTLQELLAPDWIKFYGADWRKLIDDTLNDKQNLDMQQKITLVTTITQDELNEPNWNGISISRKMQWAAKRNVTRGEDAAYSLMGIFNVNLSIAYGEGAEIAFARLIKEILNTTKTDILEIFNWAGNYHSDFSVLIPSSPRAYLNRRPHILQPKIMIEPLTTTHLGLRVPVLLLPAVPTDPSSDTYTPIGDFYATVDIKPMRPESLQENCFNVLDVKSSEINPPCCQVDDTRYRLAFAVLNSPVNGLKVDIPNYCFAIAILYSYDTPEGSIITPLAYVRKVQTTRPIVFTLETSEDYLWKSLSRNELAKHGMQYLTMHL